MTRTLLAALLLASASPFAATPLFAQAAPQAPPPPGTSGSSSGNGKLTSSKLTVKGKKSGIERTTPLLCVPDGKDVARVDAALGARLLRDGEACLQGVLARADAQAADARGEIFCSPRTGRREAGDQAGHAGMLRAGLETAYVDPARAPGLWSPR